MLPISILYTYIIEVFFISSVKRSKFEYIKQLFSKKPDKPRKFSTASLPSSPPHTRTSFMFQRASDVTSNYSTSDYASDQELEDPTPLSRHSVRPAPYANRNSKIANIVKRFEPKSANENNNPDTSTATPPSEPAGRTHSQALLEIQAISSNLSSLMTNLSIFSQVEDTVGSVVNSPKKLIVNTLMESQLNKDKQRTPKVTTSYSPDDKSRDVTADSCHSSEHGEDVISLDDFLTNLAPNRPSPPSRYPRVPREEERDSDSTEMGSGSLHNSIDTLLEEVNKVVADVTSPNTESSISDTNFTSKAPFIDSSRVEDIIPRHSTEVKYTDILPPSLLPIHTHDDITSQASDVTLSESILQIENTPVKNSSAENALPSDESYISDANLFKIQFPYENADNLNSDLRSPPFSSHRHTLSTDDAVSTGAQPTMVRSTTLDTFTTSPLLSTRIKLLDDTPTDVESSDVTSTHSMPLSPVIKHKYAGYSLPYGQSRSVSERIRSLLSRDQVDHHPKVDKLSVARAAIERKRSEVKPIIDRSVLIEVREPEEFSVKSLRERFEAKMKQMEPSGVMLTPSQLPPPARKKSEDLGIKPTFAGQYNLYNHCLAFHIISIYLTLSFRYYKEMFLCRFDSNAE